MIGPAVEWIERHVQACLAGSAQNRLTVAETGAMIPALMQAARPDLARQCALRLVSIQGEKGDFLNDNNDLGSLALAARGWMAMRHRLPEVNIPLSRLGCKLLRDLTGKSLAASRMPVVGHENSSEELSSSFLLFHFNAIGQLGELLGEKDLMQIAAEQFDVCLNQLLHNETITEVTDFCGFGCAIEALLEQNRVDDLLQLIERTGSRRDAGQDTGAGWFCTACRTQLAKAWLQLGPKEHAHKIMGLVGQLQNPSGGFFGSYGVSAANSPARESVWAATQVIEAGLLQQGFEPIRPLLHNPSLLRSGDGTISPGVATISAAQQNKRMVTLVVYFEDRNFGDLFIYETVNERLRKAGLETQTVEVSQPLEQSQLIAMANRSGFLMFVGGGLIERGAPEIIRDFCHVGSLLDVPYGLVGLSAGEFDYRHMAPSFKALADRAAFFHARDAETVEVFAASGAARLPAEGVDVAFASSRLFARPESGGRFGGNFRNVPYPQITGDMDWRKWAQALKAAGVDFLIRDASPAQQRLGLPVDGGDELQSLARCRMVVAMRYHIVLAAAAMGIVPIPIGYCPKVRRLSQQLGLSGICLDIHEPERLGAAAEWIRSRGAALRDEVLAKAAEHRCRASQMLDDVVEIVKKACYA